MKKMLIICGGQASGKTSFLYSLVDAFGEKSIIISEDQLKEISGGRLIVLRSEIHPGTELIAIDEFVDSSKLKAIAQNRPFGDDVLVVVATQLPASLFPESPYYRVHEMVSANGK
jgi:uridine kinase